MIKLTQKVKLSLNDINLTDVEKSELSARVLENQNVYHHIHFMDRIIKLQIKILLNLVALSSIVTVVMTPFIVPANKQTPEFYINHILDNCAKTTSTALVFFTIANFVFASLAFKSFNNIRYGYLLEIAEKRLKDAENLLDAEEQELLKKFKDLEKE
jgi:hypothetical protein